MIVYLVGFMGSGKSTLGKRMAASAGWRFEDLDSVIEKMEGRTISGIFDNQGEDYFRKIEAVALRNLPAVSDMVVACGGGTPCYGDNMEYMNSTGKTVYIRHEPGTLMNRILNARKERPLVRDMQPEELNRYIHEQLQEREKWYKRSSIIVDGLKADPGKLMDIIQSQQHCTHGPGQG